MIDTKVLIVGAGPVGLLNALSLVRQGIPCILVDEAAGVVRSPRAMVYHWSVLAGLDRLGILDRAIERGFRKDDYSYHVYKTGERIGWSLDVLKGKVRFPFNVHIGQDTMGDIVVEDLAREPLADLHWNTRFTGLAQDADGVTVSVTGPEGPYEIRAEWVIGADGARSPVRHALGLDFEGTTWDNRFVATNIRVDLEAKGYTRSVLQIDDVYGAIVAKIDNSDLWRCTYCEDAALSENGAADRIPGMLAKIIPEMGADYELVQYSPYRMHQRAAIRFREGRVLLAGDAAHATNPTGALGLTSGLFDTWVLQEALGAVVRGEAAPEVLDRYAEARRRSFVEDTSPQAVANCQLVYRCTDPAELERRLVDIRRMADDEALVVERSMFTLRLETPSLLTGLRTNDLETGA